MGTVVQFKARDTHLEEVIEVLDIAYEKMANLQAELDQLEEAAENLQATYDREIKAMSHRLGGMANMPVDYLLYTTLDSDVIQEIERQLWGDSIQSQNMREDTTNT